MDPNLLIEIQASNDLLPDLEGEQQAAQAGQYVLIAMGFITVIVGAFAARKEQLRDCLYFALASSAVLYVLLSIYMTANMHKFTWHKALLGTVSVLAAGLVAALIVSTILFYARRLFVDKGG